MTGWTLIWRTVRFRARSHLGTVFGAAVGSAVLIGALVVGDSVRGSLRDVALVRLGLIQTALVANDRFFTVQLADQLARKGQIDGPVVPAIRVVATATVSDGSNRANGVQLLGVDERFWKLAEDAAPFPNPKEDQVVLSRRLAEQLRVRPGDFVLLRTFKPSGLSREAPITPQENASVSLRLVVSAVASDGSLGRFSLRADQVPPFNAFVSLAVLQRALNLTDRANLLMVAAEEGTQASTRADAALRQSWTLADAELELRELPELNAVELRTSRVFLDPSVADVALKAATNATGVLTYFVNELRSGGRSVPYSMVTGMGEPVVPREMSDDEVIINQWLADDLKIKPGDELEMKYYAVGLARQLEERSARFRVRSIAPLSGAAADRNLMPDFPGIEQAESTRDWDASLPVKLDRIRPQDEEYWKRYRGTPKAFVTLTAGQKMWSDRFGDLTAVRFPMPEKSAPSSSRSGGEASGMDFRKTLEGTVLRNLSPASLGLSFEPVRAQALAAAGQSQDFGGLFLGFSLFLIVAALLLMALLFQFSVEQRATEIGTLLALGFTPRQVRRLLCIEGGVLASIGGLVGLFGGIGYARVMLHGLSTVWRGAVGASSLSFHVEPATLVVGMIASTLVAWVTVWLALRKQARRTARELLADEANAEARGQNSSRRNRRGGLLIGAGASAAALGLILWTVIRHDTTNAEIFFGAGALLLMSGLAFSSAYLSRLRDRVGQKIVSFTLGGLGVRNCARRRTRSLATVSLLACGSFLIASIGVFHLDAVSGAEKRSSGTGGFALIGESTMPVVQDLNGKNGREFFGLNAADLMGVEVVAMRVRDGDDASCLNLNRAQKPRLLGVNPESLAKRGAFTFAKATRDISPRNPWLLLHPSVQSESGTNVSIQSASPTDAAIPAVGDQNSILWAMGKKVGDTLDYTDEAGRPFKIRIVGAVANSILQGNLLIDEGEFVKRFPSEGGYRMFLIDAPSKSEADASAKLARALRDVGLELTQATTRLAEFNAVQNTYLGTFQVLGGLGLILGSLGLGVVVLRNVLERRGELAVLLAVGFRSASVRWLVLSEHAVLLILGLAIGVVAALVAVVPALLSPGADVPFASLSWTLAGVLGSGAVWTWLASRAALRGRLLDALRND